MYYRIYNLYYQFFNTRHNDETAASLCYASFAPSIVLNNRSTNN